MNRNLQFRELEAFGCVRVRLLTAEGRFLLLKLCIFDAELFVNLQKFIVCRVFLHQKFQHHQSPIDCIRVRQLSVAPRPRGVVALNLFIFDRRVNHIKQPTV